MSEQTENQEQIEQVEQQAPSSVTDITDDKLLAMRQRQAEIYQQHKRKYENELIDIKKGRLEKSVVVNGLIAPLFDYWQTTSFALRAATYRRAYVVGLDNENNLRNVMVRRVQNALMKMAEDYELEETFDLAQVKSKKILMNLMDMDKVLLDEFKQVQLMNRIKYFYNKEMQDEFMQHRAAMVVFALDDWPKMMVNEENHQYLTPANDVIFSRTGYLGDFRYTKKPGIFLSHMHDPFQYQKDAFICFTDAPLPPGYKFMGNESVIVTDLVDFEFNCLWSKENNCIAFKFDKVAGRSAFFFNVHTEPEGEVKC